MTRRRFGSRGLALIAVLIVLIAASILADRLGAPWPVTTVTMIGVAVAGFAFAGITSRTLRLSTFRVAGQRLGWSRGGSFMLAIALGLSLIGEARPYAVAQAAIIAAAGVLAFGVMYAAPLRAAGAAGLGSFAMARYRSRGLAALVGLAALAIGLALAITAARPALAAFSAIPVLSADAARMIFLALLLVMVLPGGAASLGATAVVAAFLALAAYGLPTAIIFADEDAGALDALARTSLAMAGADFTTNIWLAALAAAVLALCGAGPAMRSPGLARQVSAGAALAAIGVAASLLITLFAVVQVNNTLGDVPPQKLPALIYAERAQGLTTICGIAPSDPVAVERACRPHLAEGNVPAGQIRILAEGSPRWMAAALDLPMSLAALAMIAPAVLLSLLVAAALRFAVAGLIDDALYRLGHFSGTASGRMALHRLALGGGAVALAYGSVPPVPAIAMPPLVLFAILLPAVLILPGLSGRADWRSPLVLLVAAAAIAALPVLAPELPIPAWGWAVLLLGIGVGTILLLPSRDAADAHAAAVLRGAAPGPLMEGDG